MKNTQFKTGLDELVFEGRNKAYGAYVLRKNYTGNLLKAVGGAITLLLLLFAIPFISALMREVKISETISPTDTVEIFDLTAPPKEILEIPKAKEIAIEQVKTVANTIPEIVPDPLAKTEMTPNEILSKANAGTITNLVGTENPAKVATQYIVSAVAVDTEPVNYAEKMPEFIGGYDAMIRFMQQNVTYPEIAKEVGISGTVYVQFVIDRLGKISNVSVLHGIGGGCDEEAMRVIKMMPAWKPGMQNDKTVSVRYTYPIKFKLN